jgi:hypothetical protein
MSTRARKAVQVAHVAFRAMRTGNMPPQQWVPATRPPASDTTGPAPTHARESAAVISLMHRSARWCGPRVRWCESPRRFMASYKGHCPPQSKGAAAPKRKLREGARPERHGALGTYVDSMQDRCLRLHPTNSQCSRPRCRGRAG